MVTPLQGFPLGCQLLIDLHIPGDIMPFHQQCQSLAYRVLHTCGVLV
jgi:hypothetical protein